MDKHKTTRNTMAGLANRHTVCDLTFSHKDDDGRLQWSVDIMREGVDQPVDSFLISKTNMPPRYNKNRKVAWQLPLVETVAVRLGAADVMRVLDLYQERRKDRQRQAAKENKYQESVLSSRLSSGALATTSAEVRSVRREARARIAKHMRECTLLTLCVTGGASYH